MKFKVDENLPSEYVSWCRVEGRVLMTLDLDFANVQTYPPKSHAGIVVFRPKFQDKPTLIAILQRLISTLARQTVSFALSNMTASDIGKIETPC